MAGTIGIGFNIGAKVGPTVASAFKTVESRLARTQRAVGQHTKELAAYDRYFANRKALNAAQMRVASNAQDEKAVRDVQRLSVAYREAKAAALSYCGSLTKLHAAQAMANKRMAIASQRSALMNGLDAQKAHRRDLMGQAMAVGASAMAYTAPLRVGLGFEQSMSRVKAISGATGEELKALTAQARQLGATTVWSAKEAAEGMSFLSMAGFNAQQTMAAMPGMLSLASAGAVDLGTTADIASNILTGFGFEAAKMGFVSDVLAKTFTRSNTTLQSLGESFKYCAPAASKAGQSFELTAAMIGALGNAGIQGSEAGTGLNAIMSRMASPPKAAAAALDKLGISIADSSGNMRSMSDIFLEISRKTAGMGEVQRLAYAKALFGVNHFAKGLVLMSAAADGSLQKLATGLYEEGYATRVATEQTDNLSGDLKALNSASEELGISLYTSVLPALRVGAHLLTSIVQGVGQWTKAHPYLTQALMLTVGVLLVYKTAAISCALVSSLMKTSILQTALAANYAKGFMIAWGVATKATAAAQWVLNAAMANNPLGLVIKGVALLVMGMWHLYNTCEPVRAVFDKVFSFIADKLSWVWNGVKSVVGKVGSWLGLGGDDEDEKKGSTSAAQSAQPAPAPAAAVVPPPVATPTPPVKVPPLPPSIDEDAGMEAEDFDAEALAAATAPAPRKKRRKRSESGTGAGAGSAANVTVNMNFTVGGMPAQDFANGVVKAVKDNKGKLESILTDIVHNQMRVAYGQ